MKKKHFSEQKIVKFAMPVYYPQTKSGKNDVLEKIGTFFIIKYKFRYFIVTAKHLLEVHDLSYLCFGIGYEFALDKCIVNKSEGYDCLLIEIEESHFKTILMNL